MGWGDWLREKAERGQFGVQANYDTRLIDFSVEGVA
jgi:hypothetical protein